MLCFVLLFVLQEQSSLCNKRGLILSTWTIFFFYKLIYLQTKPLFEGQGFLCPLVRGTKFCVVALNYRHPNQLGWDWSFSRFQSLYLWKQLLLFYLEIILLRVYAVECSSKASKPQSINEHFRFSILQAIQWNMSYIGLWSDYSLNALIDIKDWKYECAKTNLLVVNKL